MVCDDCEGMKEYRAECQRQQPVEMLGPPGEKWSKPTFSRQRIYEDFGGAMFALPNKVLRTKEQGTSPQFTAYQGWLVHHDTRGPHVPSAVRRNALKATGDEVVIMLQPMEGTYLGQVDGSKSRRFFDFLVTIICIIAIFSCEAV